MNIIITGGHSGMGLELSKKLLSEGHRIGLIVRSQKRKEETLKLFSNESKVSVFIADLSKRDHIKSVANEIRNRFETVDGLFNNAGVLLDQLYFSDYGNELHLEVNAISPYLLTQELLPLLEKSEKAFVVSTATAGLNTKKELPISNFKKPKKFTKLTGSYMDSKLTLVTLMNYLSESSKKVQFISVNPGAIKTKMTAGDGMPFWLKPIRNLLFKSPEEGANNLYKAAFRGENSASGIYINGGKKKQIQVKIDKQQIEELLNG